jgi:hypothetical protein
MFLQLVPDKSWESPGKVQGQVADLLVMHQPLLAIIVADQPIYRR